MSSDSSSGEGEAISHQPSPGSYPGEGDTPSTTNTPHTRGTVNRSTSNLLTGNIVGSEIPTSSSSTSPSSSNRRVRRSSSSSPSATPAKRYKTPETPQQLQQHLSRLVRSPRQNNLQESRTASPFGCSSPSPSSPNSVTGLPSTSRSIASSTATVTSSLPTAASAVSGEDSEDKPQTMPSLFPSGDDSGNNLTGASPSSNGSSYARSNGFTNGAGPASENYLEGSSGINGNSTTNGTSNGQRFFSKSVRDYEIIRLISQQLRDYGFHQTVDTLMQESGCKSDHPVASRFQQHIMNGEWSEAEADLNEMKSLINDSNAIIEMRFLILEQKYLEQLDCDKTSEALETLRSSLTPLNHRRDRIHELTTLIMCHSKDEMHTLASWQGKGVESRAALMEKLQMFIPPEIMLPPHRLTTLLAQAVEMQKAKCRLHNDLIDSNFDGVSLLTDHECTSAQFPMKTLQILPNHCEEVCYCAFSNDGTKLATGSKDNTVIIWDVDGKTLEVKYRMTLDGHTNGAFFLAWSPDDTHLLVCGPDECAEIWVWNIQTGDLRVKANQTPEDSLTACAWHKDGKKFVTGGTKGQFYQFDLDGNMVCEAWEGVRVQCLAWSKDGKTVLAADSHHRIRGYNFDSEDRSDQDIIKEKDAIMSFTVDSSGRYALINISNKGIHMWDLEDRVLVRAFQGVVQGFYVIHSCFGGVNDSFVASGSEDSNIYIYKTKCETPIAVLSGHCRSVNCVSWNRKYPQLLASVSDDSTVRIWGPENMCAKRSSAATVVPSSSTSASSSATVRNGLIHPVTSSS